MKSAPRLVAARACRERSPALCEAVIREALGIDELVAWAPTSRATLTDGPRRYLPRGLRPRIAGALVGETPPLLTAAMEAGFDDLVEVLRKHGCPIDDDDDTPAVQPPPPPRPREEGFDV